MLSALKTHVVQTARKKKRKIEEKNILLCSLVHLLNILISKLYTMLDIK